MTETRLRTLLVGVDAACRPVLDPLLARGDLPAFADLRERGAYGDLTSNVPPWTPSAWPSLFTGVNPGKHGVYGFLQFDGYDYDVVNRTHVREHALWELADRHGLTSVVVNVPVTDPPRPVRGAVLPGYTAPTPPTCHPEGVLADVREHAGDYAVYPPGTDDRDETVAGYRTLVAQRGAAFRYLAERFDPEFGFLQFQATDSVVHDLPGDREALAAVYRAVDDQLGRVLDATDPDTVLVVSDHGIGPYEGYEFRANEYLREHGFVTTTTGGEGMPSWASVERHLRGTDESAGASLARRALGLAARAGLTAQRGERLLGRLGLADAVARLLPADALRAGTEQVDFERSRAYVRSRIECGVRVNLAGREPAGVVDPGAYDAVRAELVDALSAARTPDGDPVFERVCRREALYDGPHVAAAPDVVCVPADFDQFLSASLRGSTFGPPSEPWNHKLQGLVLAAGAGVDPGVHPGAAHLLDVAPTVLSTLGVPASDRMDGSHLPFVAPPETTQYPAFAGDEHATDDRAVEARLSDLGYID